MHGCATPKGACLYILTFVPIMDMAWRWNPMHYIAAFGDTFFGPGASFTHPMGAASVTSFPGAPFTLSCSMSSTRGLTLIPFPAQNLSTFEV